MSRFRYPLGLGALLPCLGACGGGTVASEDVDAGEAVVIAVVVVVALLYVAFVGGRGGR